MQVFQVYLKNMRVFPRDNYLEFLRRVTDRDLVRIITGVRRCGKSTPLELYREDLVRGGVDPPTDSHHQFRRCR